MRVAPLATIAVTVALVSGCGLASEPENVFDDYVEAYADGESETMWDLSSPAARADAKRIKTELMAGLTNPDAAIRLDYEGTFGTTADDVGPLNEKQFFLWAVDTIRRRLGSGYVRNTLSRWERVRIETVNSDNVVVIYRWGDRVGRLPLARVDDAWRVNQSPFPKEGDTPKDLNGEPEVEIRESDPYKGGGDPAW